MANKLALLALLAALLVVTDATILRTTITTTEIEEDNPYHGGGGGGGGGSSTHQQQQCSSRQLQGKQFNSCKSYLQSKSSRPYDILRVVDVNPFTEQKMMLQECCEELQELRNPQCACEALKKIIREETQQGTSRYQGQQEIRPMLQKAKNIPEQCNLQIRSCRFEDQ